MFQYLYLSRLASGHDFSCFKAIVHTSRQNNRLRGISGALLFDGERFCQLLEGPQPAVEALVARIILDPRHTDLTVLHAALVAPSPRRPAWTSGYCDADALDVFGNLSVTDASAGDGLRGDRAVTAFAALLALADLAD